MMKAWAVVVVLATTGALSLVASTETDWSGKSGAVTIPAGETWVADEADMAQVNALASITLAAAEGETDAGTLIFRDTTTVPKAGLLAGAGKVVKTGDSSWTLTTAQSGFTGDWYLRGGITVPAILDCCGATDKESVGGLYVEDGATLHLNNSNPGSPFRWRKVHIAGKGCSSMPYALNVDAAVSSAVAYLQLEGDAKLRIGANYWWISNQGANANKPFKWNGKAYGGIIDLKSYTLECYSETYDWNLLSIRLSGSGRLVMKNKGYVYRDSSSNFGDADEELGPIVMDNALDWQSIRFYNRPNIVYRPLEIKANALMSYSANDSTSHLNLANTNRNHLAGNVTIAAGKTLKISPNYSDNSQITISGTISGAGSLRISDYTSNSSAERGIACLAGHNTYTGGTEVRANGRSGLKLYYPDSLPSYADTKVDAGYVAAVLGFDLDGETPRWRKSDFWSFINTANLVNFGHFSIDASECPGAVYELSAEEINENVSNPDRRAIGSAGGVLRIRNDSKENPQRVMLATDRGRVELVGGGAFTLAPTNILKGTIVLSEGPKSTNPMADNTPIAEVRVCDGSKVVQDNEKVFVGGMNAYGNTSEQAMARLVISNATWTTTYDGNPQSGGEPELATGAIWVGHLNRGILEIQDGAFVSNRVVVGGGSSFSKGDGIGAIYQSGGEFHLVAKGKPHLTSSIGTANFGYFEQSRGKFVAGEIHLANYGNCVTHVYGGEAKLQAIELAAANGGRAYFYMTNGTWSVDSYIRVCSGSDCYSQFTVDGPTARVETKGAIYGSQFAHDIKDSSGTVIGHYCSAVARFNLNNGGTLRSDYIVLYNGKELSLHRDPHPYILGFNGGVFETYGGGYTDGLFGRSADNRFSDVIVYEGGATVKTDVNYEQSVHTPMEGATGNGIVAITLPETVYYGSVGAPRVTIENIDGGTGVGATAVADWDVETRSVKGIIITSHGWGYEADKVRVRLFAGGVWEKTFQNSATVTCVTVAPNRAGGFTKAGTGRFTLNAVNTWAGWTAIEGGTLRTCATNAIPSGTELRLNGGTLDLNNIAAEHLPTFTGLVGTGGTVKNGTVKIVGNWQISAKKFIDRETTALTGTLDLSACTGITIVDTEVLDKAAEALDRLNLFTATEIIWPAKTLPIAGDLPNNWRVKLTDTKISLGFGRGLVVILK